MSRLPSIADQDRRRAQLAQLRTQRPLGIAEIAEEERLEKALYTRTWRAQARDEERKLNMRLAAQAPNRPDNAFDRAG